jgi:hypothetical protein
MLLMVFAVDWPVVEFDWLAPFIKENLSIVGILSSVAQIAK